VVFDQHALRRNSASFSQKYLGVVGVVQDIGKENCLERGIAEREFLSIEHFYWDVGTFPR